MDGWFQFWTNFVIPFGYQDREILPVQDTGGDGASYMLNMTDVKALAFDELYNRLPSPASIHLVHEMVEGAPSELRSVHDFLTNLPTRVK